MIQIYQEFVLIRYREVNLAKDFIEWDRSVNRVRNVILLFFILHHNILFHISRYFWLCFDTSGFLPWKQVLAIGASYQLFLLVLALCM